jgi:hypothetical protein
MAVSLSTPFRGSCEEIDVCYKLEFGRIRPITPSGMADSVVAQVKIGSLLLRAAILAGALMAGAGANAENTVPADKEKLPIQSSRKSVSIFNNSGGKIALFAIKLAEYRDEGTLVKFSGRCDSACTLFLSLPKRQTCINPGAYFRFHAPSARSLRSERLAQTFMAGKYPDWVRSWIQEKGGLSNQLLRMDYAYASQFIPGCEVVALR